ncbi:hypothetical protein VNO77_31015 [Canavalia gladiata]|uniref:Uncharacterized protein n=1 Tax=Canavalia gladiata TaxID=3824 RepID=A0AAN9KRC8_CANGL
MKKSTSYKGALLVTWGGGFLEKETHSGNFRWNSLSFRKLRKVRFFSLVSSANPAPSSTNPRSVPVICNPEETARRNEEDVIAANFAERQHCGTSLHAKNMRRNMSVEATELLIYGCKQFPWPIPTESLMQRRLQTKFIEVFDEEAKMKCVEAC